MGKLGKGRTGLGMKVDYEANLKLQRIAPSQVQF